MTVSKGEIIRLGDKIRNQYGNITPETLLELEDFRTSHKDSLADIFIKLCKIRHKVANNIIVTYRIKRFESIINKLHRFPKMKFDRMWDIGGCRCIVKNNTEAYKLKKEIEKILVVKKVNDYIENPQEDGYKSIHLYASLPNDDKTIEIQIRNQVDHNWATLVEISDLLYDSGLKEYGKNKDLLRFHKLLSDIENLSILEKKEIAKIIRKYSYVDNINKVFIRNHINVRQQWLAIETNSRQQYFLIESSKKDIPKIEAYDNFNDAEKAYFSKFKNNQKANIVLTHLPKSSYNQISVAYSNYILTMHSFEDDSSRIFESLVLHSLENGNYLDFFKYFDYLQKILIYRINNSVQELISAQIPQNDTSKKSHKQSKKEIQWQKDVMDELNSYRMKVFEFQKMFKKFLPPKGIKKMLVKRILKFIFWKYKRKLKKLGENII